MMVLAARSESTNSGFYLLCFLAGALFLLWPIYRRILFGLGTAFIIFGAILLVAHLGGASNDLSQIGGLSAGGLLLRLIGGLRCPRPRRRAKALRRRLERPQMASR